MKHSSRHDPYLLTISEVAWLLGVDTDHISRAIRVGTLPTVRRRRRLLVPANALDHLADHGDQCTDTTAQQGVRGDAR